MPVFNQSRKRVIQLIFVVVLLVIVGQLFHLQIVSSKYAKLAEDNAVAKKIAYPSRGIIFDRKGRAILDNIARFDLVVTPFQVKNIDTIALCSLLQIDTTEFNKRMVTSIVKNGRYRPSVFEPFVSTQLQAQLDENMYKFPGFDLSERPVRTYPYKAAAHILGYVAEVDTAIIRKSGYFYQMGDLVGRSGLEKYYEKVLMGQRGINYLIKDNKNRIQGSYEKGVFDTAAQAGRNLYTSVDIDLQQLAEKLLKNKLGAVVAINPKTGGILAMSSGPSYDPNDLAGAAFRKNWGRLALDTARPLYNRAIKGQYPPGSTFKPLGGLVALDEGLITPAYGYPCGGAYYGCAGIRVKCEHAGGGHAASLRSALANSCNSYFCQVFRMAIDNPTYHNTIRGYLKWKEYMNSFGMGVRLGVDLPSEDYASIPDTSRYNKDFGGSRRWNSCSILTLGIGQDRMTATPLQMANVLSVIANRGYYYTPHFVDSIQDETTADSVYLGKFRARHDVTHISNQAYQAVVDGMYDVTQYGTAAFLKVPGVEYCAKTGTAQNPHGKNHSIFTCFAPRNNPKIAIAVVVENAGYGATWAGPIGTLLMEKYLNDTISAESMATLDRVSKADLIPAAIKHWYYVKDSIRHAKLAMKEVSVDTVIEQPAVVPKKTTFDPEVEPNRKDTSESTYEKTPMLSPEEKKNKHDSTKNEEQ
jgi:penicillin-binding protein 2